LKSRREGIFKPIIENGHLLEISYDNVVRAVNFTISKNLIGKRTVFHIATFINMLELLLLGKHAIRLMSL
jgi:hypothetical protein